MFGRKKLNRENYEEYDYEEDYEDYEDAYEEEDEEGEPYLRGYARENDSDYQDSHILERENERLTQEMGYLKNKLHILEIAQPDQENSKIKQEVKTLQQNVLRLEREVKDKQTEVEQLTLQLLDIGDSTEELQNLETKLNLAHVETTKEQEKVRSLKEQIEAEAGMRVSIADVMIEAKETSKQIVGRAEYEAQKLLDTANIKASRMVSEAQVELGMIQKEAANYYQKVSYTREEASTLFDQLLEKLAIVQG